MFPMIRGGPAPARAPALPARVSCGNNAHGMQERRGVWYTVTMKTWNFCAMSLLKT